MALVVMRKKWLAKSERHLSANPRTIPSKNTNHFANAFQAYNNKKSDANARETNSISIISLLFLGPLLSNEHGIRFKKTADCHFYFILRFSNKELTADRKSNL